MEKVLEDYKEERFCFEAGSLEFSCPRLELFLQKNEKAEGHFTIWSNEKRPIKGYVVSDSSRMQCLTSCFEEHTAQIAYCFDTTGLEEGEVLKGEIDVITSQGEYYLPYVVTVEYFKVESSLGTVKNLFHFANLAKTNWEEAVALFYAPGFQEIFKGSDENYETVYRGFLQPAFSQNNVEEFLLEIRKKQAIEYLPDTELIELRDLQDSVQGTLFIDRNGWGYTYLEVTAEGDFLRVGREVLQNEDFVENRCGLAYEIDADKLHAGNNYGSITLSNIYTSIRIEVRVHRSREQKRFQKKKLQKQYFTLHLMQYYLAMRMEKISSQTWLKKTEQIIGEWTSIDHKSVVCKLFNAQLLMAQERYNEARWLLENTPNLQKEAMQDEELYCYYLYLNTLDEKDKVQIRLIAEQIGDIHRRHPDRWRIAWLRIYADEEYAKSPSRKWMLLEELFYQNCTSPLLYLEAVNVMAASPTLLLKLNRFEMQTLRFAAKHRLLTEDVIRQIHYAVSRMKHYQEPMIYILQACYDKMQDDETLQAICTHLIKGNRTDQECFAWYRLGVERQLHITRLYEYFMMSIDEAYDGTIPKRVLMYFVYRSNLTYQKRAFLYAYIVRNEDSYPELYRTYLPDMEEFIKEQILKQHVNRNLLYLYKKLLTRQMLQEYANEIVPLLFTKRIHTDHRQMRRVVVRYSYKTTESYYPLVNGEAFLPLLGEEYKVFLEDAQKNRYREGIPYETDRLLSASAAIHEAAPYVTRYLDFDLYLCRGNKHYVDVNEDNVERIRRLAGSEEIASVYRNKLNVRLSEYYFKEDKLLLLDELLKSAEPKYFNMEERAEFIRYMVIREQMEKALLWMSEYGAEKVDVKTILRLCTRMLAESGLYDRPQLGELALAVFKKGKYNEAALLYLMQYFQGNIKQMRDIWKAAREFDTDTAGFSERLLIQQLFTGAYLPQRLEIFQDYLKGNVRDMVKQAFLSCISFEYFVKEQVLDDCVWAQIQTMCEEKEETAKIMKLAYLKWLSTRVPKLTARELESAETLLRECLSDNIFFAFFQEFGELPIIAGRFADKTILEYRAKPESRIILHYLTEGEMSLKDEYYKEEMKHMYGGIFVKSFVLFFGEKLQYYITEEEDNTEQLTESGSLNNSELGRAHQEDRYTVLNDIVTALSLQDYGTVDLMMKEYGQMDFMVQHLFAIQ